MKDHRFETKFPPAYDYFLTGEEAFFGILFAAMTADGKVCEQEIDKIWSVVDDMLLFSGIPEEGWSQIVDNLSIILEKEGHEALAHLSARYLPPAFNLTAYTIAVDLLFSDGVVNYHEKLFMEELRHMLGVDRQFAEQVVKSTALRYLDS